MKGLLSYDELIERTVLETLNFVKFRQLNLEKISRYDKVSGALRHKLERHQRYLIDQKSMIDSRLKRIDRILTKSVNNENAMKKGK
jgi:hypothetical protein